MEQRFYSLVLIIIGELLSYVIGSSAMVLFHSDVVDAVVFGPVLILLIDLEGEVGAFAPFTSGDDIEAFVIDHWFRVHSRS